MPIKTKFGDENMRHFNFRAWSSSENKMYYPYKDKKPEWTIDNKTGFIAPNVVIGETDWGQAWGMLDKYILMQGTGLRDTVGQEVYEGDVIETLQSNLTSVPSPHRLGIVEYKSDHARFEPKYFKTLEIYTYTMPQACGMPIKFKIVGNIYQNAELLAEN